MTHYQRLVLSGLLIIMKMLMVIIYRSCPAIQRKETEESLTWVEIFAAQINDAFTSEEE